MTILLDMDALAALARLALTNADRGGSSPEARALLERIAAGANA
ncbi:MAG: hypothetical protein U1E28_21835 [Beijerinckiaceae bacterium]